MAKSFESLLTHLISLYEIGTNFQGATMSDNKNLNELVKLLTGSEKIKTTEGVKAIEAAYNIPFPEDLKLLLSAISSGDTEINYNEWRITSEDMTDYTEGNEQNMLEHLISLDQNNYLGTWMLELFSNSIYLGSFGNGDCYFANLNLFEEKKDKGNVEIVYFNHETYDFEFPFADSIESLITINNLLDDIGGDKKIDSGDLKKEMESLKMKINPTWHFRELEEITGIESHYESLNQGKILMFRALWLIYLLRDDGVTGIRQIPDLFALFDHQPIGDVDEFAAGITEENPISSIYWLWYFFFFNKEESLKKVCDAFKKIKSPLIQDSINLVMELQNGRKNLGKIKDIHKLRKNFLKLDLDPERKGERKVESNKAKEKKKKKDKKDKEKAKKIIAKNKIEELPKIAWEYIHDEIIIETIFQYLRDNDSTLQPDFERYDFIIENRHQRDNMLFDFEIEETIGSLFDAQSRLAPLLFIKGIVVAAPEASEAVQHSLEDLLPVEDFEELRHFKYLNQMHFATSDSLETLLIELLPKPEIPHDVVKKMKFEDSIGILAPIFGNMKSRKAVTIFLEYIDVYKERILDKDPNDAARAKNSFNDKIAPILFNAFRKIGDERTIPVLKEYIDTELKNYAIDALIHLGDSDVIPLIQSIVDAEEDLPIKNIMPRILLAYALHKGGKEPDVETAKLALGIVMSKEDANIKLHTMALEIIAKWCPKDEAHKLILSFLEGEHRDVRLGAINALESIGENYSITYCDRAYVDYLYKDKNNGKASLIELLSNPAAVFKHNILRKLADENDTTGFEDIAIEYISNLTRFEHYTNPYIQDTFTKTNYAIYALAKMKIKKFDDYLYTLMAHPNVMFRNNDLFQYKNYEHSDYLSELMKNPPEIKKSSVK